MSRKHERNEIMLIHRRSWCNSCLEIYSIFLLNHILIIYGGNFADNQKHALLPTPSDLSNFFAKVPLGTNNVSEVLRQSHENMKKNELLLFRRRSWCNSCFETHSFFLSHTTSVSESGLLQNFDFKRHSDYFFIAHVEVSSNFYPHD